MTITSKTIALITSTIMTLYAPSISPASITELQNPKLKQESTFNWYDIENPNKIFSQPLDEYQTPIPTTTQINPKGYFTNPQQTQPNNINIQPIKNLELHLSPQLIPTVNNEGFFQNFETQSQTPTSTVPTPTSIILLGCGLAAILGIPRNKIPKK